MGGGGSDTPTDYTTKYVGTWNAACETDTDIVDANTNNLAHSVYSFAFSRVDEKTMKAVLTINVYGSTDTNCSQTSLGKIVWSGSGVGNFSYGASGITSGAGVTLVVDGQTTVSNKTVDKVTFSIDALSSTTNATYTVGTAGHQFKVTSSSFPAGTSKDLYYLNGTTITTGDDTGVATGQYPTTLLSTPTFTKQ